ncbi:alpha/beta hydrolase fold domain-containing protein [Ruminococcus sp.]|uniref:alpha/beta hydrolase fold domain-containing protein n=1 Tax=Ruminococcus sp. TaxID=41978 RepID=UPI0025FF7B98|nr:alpha/beta hydrolase fold domain-containing protein [Ruminococcus sp.]MBQ8967096.1 alpha/beta hydrolase fold domain-containing protein [Ruminococcus sp.]
MKTAVIKMIANLVLKDVHALNSLEGEAFREGLRKYKQKHKRTSAPPAKIRKAMDIRACKVGGGIFYRAKDKNVRSSKKVLFIHGGGFIAEAMYIHWSFCRSLAADTGCEIFFPQYPLVPESNAEKANDMLMRVYERLLKECAPEDLTVMGDSAGGTLALSLSMLARDKGLPLPKNIILISPGFSIGEMTEAEKKRAAYLEKQDFILSGFPIEKVKVLWRGDLAEDDYRANVSGSSVEGLPPITMFSGTHDTLNIPARRYAEKLKKAAHPHIYIEKKGGIHDYALSPKNKREYDIMISKIMGR